MKHDQLASALDLLDLRLNEAAVRRLLGYAALLRERAAPLGFISPGDAAAALERHVLDCLRAVPYVEGTAAVDIGSGAGLPGIPVAIARPDVSITLLEAQRRRVAFIEMVCAELAIANAVPLHVRVEAFRGRVDTCLARAFAPLRASWSAAASLLEPGGRLIYFAGALTDISAEGLTPAPADMRTVPGSPVLASAGPLVIMTLQ